MNRKNFLLLAVGAVLMSLSLLLKHFFIMTDFWDGATKGVAIGLMLISVYRISKGKRRMV